jgi:adenylyltransferase/sulfurtransferase
MKLSLDDSGRYHRQELITWCDQSKLKASKVLVVGAGAIGNEVVKNLALVGVGTIHVCDMDTIENSNLARCAFFREEDKDQFKAEVLARRAQELNSDIYIEGHPKSVQGLGAAFFAQFDLVIGALDNREARVWVNQVSRKLGIPWIDGAIEGLRGIVRMFDLTGPCYNCTLSEADYIGMSHRRSCALLAPEDIVNGKTPTNASTSSIVAAVQVQEAIKYLVGKSEMLSLVGSCWVFVGDSMTSYITRYQEDPDCVAHDRYEDMERLESIVTMREILKAARSHFGNQEEIYFDFEDDLVYLTPCPNHGGERTVAFRSSLQLGAGLCGTCGVELLGHISSSVDSQDEVFDLTLVELGASQHEIVTARQGMSRVHFLLERANV